LGIDRGGSVGMVYGVEVFERVPGFKWGTGILSIELDIWVYTHYISAVDSSSVLRFVSKLLDAGVIPRLRDYMRDACLGRQVDRICRNLKRPNNTQLGKS
jgi:hypothetical protein